MSTRRLWVVLLGVLAVVLATLPAVAAGVPGDPPPEPGKQHRRSYDDLRVSAERAKASGGRQELKSERREDSTSYIEPSGRTTEVINSRPTRVRKGGELRDVDTNLTQRGSRLEPKATRADVAVAETPGSDQPLVTLARKGRWIGLSWDEALPKAQVDGPKATFRQGAKNRQVEITATDNGFNFRVVLDKAPATAPVYRIPVSTSGVTLRQGQDNGFVATDGSGEVVFRIAPAVMWDHTQDSRPAGPEEVVPVDTKLVQRSGGQVIELRPDFGWLSSKARVWPVTVDPDTYVNYLPYAARTTFTLSKAPYNGTSYATASALRVGNHPTFGKANGYLFQPVPPREGGAVLSASLRLFQWDSGSCTPTPMTIYPLSSPGFEDNITALSTPQPAYDVNSPYKVTQSFAKGVDGACADNFVTIDVTPMVKAWVGYTPAGIDGAGNPVAQVGIPNYGVVMRASDTDTTAFKAFCSAVPNSATVCNATRVPVLTITYNTPPTITVDLGETPATCYTGDVPAVTTLIPTLTGTARDVDTDPQATGADTGQEKVRLHFEIWPLGALEFTDPYVQDPAVAELAPRVAEGYSAYVEQDTPASWTVPAGVLTDGSRYVWRAIADDGVSTSPYWSNWRAFQTDTTLSPELDCPVRLLLSSDAAAAAGILQPLADQSPDRYFSIDWDSITGALPIRVTPAASQSEQDAVAAARQEALNTLNASADLTDEQKLSAADALQIVTVKYSRPGLEAVVADIEARRAANDPVLVDVVAVEIDPGRNAVIVGATNPTSELQAAMQSSYGDRVIVEQQVPREPLAASYIAGQGPYDSDKTYPYGGKAIKGLKYCSSAFPMKTMPPPPQSSQTLLLTAGHCLGAVGSNVHNVACDREKLRTLIGTVRAKKTNTLMDAGTIAPTAPTKMSPRMYTGAGWKRKAGATPAPNPGWLRADPPSSASCDEPNPGNTIETDRNDYPTRAGYESLVIGSASFQEKPPTSVCKWGVVTGFYCNYTVGAQVGSKNRYKTVYTGPFDSVKKGWPKWDDMPKADSGDSGGPVFLIIDEDRQLGKPGLVHAIGIVIDENGSPHWRSGLGTRNGSTGFVFQTIFSIMQDLDISVLTRPVP